MQLTKVFVTLAAFFALNASAAPTWFKREAAEPVGVVFSAAAVYVVADN